jgi:glycerol-1-phosphate dehydrogenase [NAD(P)+]
MDNLDLVKKKILLVTDQNVFPIAEKIIKQLSCQSLILQSPKADKKTVLDIADQAQNYDLIIAVGSGVINDLCKVASFRLNIPYIIFGTAPSMNGYASANASITVDSHKTSIPAHLPTAIYLDLDVLENAPARLIKSGIGDSLCFSTCQFDWLLSHLILGTNYNSTPFDLLKSHYQELTNNDLKIKALVEMLIISGLGMYICGGSYPASQAEHLIAHYIEIRYPKVAENSYHGEQIAVTTLSVAEIQERILSMDKIKIQPTQIDQNNLERLFDKELVQHFSQEIKNKFIDQNLADKINLQLSKDWQGFKQQLSQCFVSKNDLFKLYQKFSLPQAANDIEIGNDIYQEALDNAHLIRNRFTSLDFIKLIKPL